VQSLRRQMEQFNDATLPLNRWYECGYLFCKPSSSTL
jgi:hypothetical protein